ncbi:universal stress protein [Legionella pneumophila]|uniref:universal stress protein n=1 Tax=Legionella pneumophila TaxID=446 RepID=UPI00086323FF|nr:universal stress protein [Legionella pneumophila]AOU64476.1 hypothetical protein A9E90_10265 [Legionella pneumophila]
MSKKIIACIDHSSLSKSVCDWASWSSIHFNKPLLFLHALDNVPSISRANLSGNLESDSREKLLEELAKLDEQRNKIALEHGKHLLEDVKKRALTKGVKDVFCLQRHERLLETVVALETEISLLVIGRQGEQTQAYPTQIGSQLETTIRGLNCPILVAASNFRPPKQVLFAFDASPTAFRILNRLVNNSDLLRGLVVHLIMVNHSAHKPQFKEAASLLKSAEINVTTCLFQGSVEDTIFHYIEENNIDLIIMGAYGHSRIRQFLIGSTTSEMLHKTPISLLLVR